MGQTTDLHATAFQVIHRWWQAWIERDAKVIAEMASADYSERDDMGHLRTLGPGRLKELLSCPEADCVITEWQLSDPVTRLFDNVIVCSYAFRFSGRRRNRSFLYEGRATDVLSWKNDHWTIISHEGVLHGRGRLVRQEQKLPRVSHRARGRRRD